MIIEFSDFTKWLNLQHWQSIRDHLSEGKRLFEILSKDGNHIEFDSLWFLIGCFRQENHIPFQILGPNNEPITMQDYRNLLTALESELCPESGRPETTEKVLWFCWDCDTVIINDDLASCQDILKHKVVRIPQARMVNP